MPLDCESAIARDAGRVERSADDARSLERFVVERGLTMRERMVLLREVCRIARRDVALQVVCGSASDAFVSPTSLWVTSAGLPWRRASARPAGDDPAFLSPQQRAGSPPSEADCIFALGALLWWLVTERSPGATGEQAAHAEASARSPFRRELAEIARHAMASVPQARYRTVAEFDAELARWQARRPVAAVGRHWRYRARKWLDRRAPASMLVAVVLGVGSLTLLLSRG